MYLVHSCTVFRLQHTENALVVIYSQILEEFHVLKESFKKLFSLSLYAIFTFWLFINENSTMNAMYGVFLVHLSLRPSSHEIYTVIRPIFFAPLVTVLMGLHCPLYYVCCLGGKGGPPYDGLYREAPLERKTFFQASGI